MDLTSLGWDAFFEQHFQSYSGSDFFPARVALGHKHACTVYSALGEFSAECTGRLLHDTIHRSQLPVVGDWVVVRARANEMRGDIHAVLPRRTRFSRSGPDDADGEQVVAANLDAVFLVCALDGDFNLRRIERYLTVARESGAQPIVVLNKADLHPDPAGAQAEVTAIAQGAPVVALSAVHDPNPGALLAAWLQPGRTVALLGSSGAGKSTLINRLLGSDRQKTGVTSETHGKGKHTTTHRELIVSPHGPLVIDTPGMRELQLWDVAAPSLEATFGDIILLASGCRFRDCTHRSEPGCAVQRALADGTLDAARWQSFLKLEREQAYAARKADPIRARENRNVWKKITKDQRARYRHEPEP
jgi:ribosome biogenesis GTPase